MATSKATKTLPGAQKAVLPDKFSPMLLHAEKTLKPKEGWSYEPKLDGMRAIALIAGGKCKLLSRNGRDITNTFPELSAQLARQKGELILDAEIIAVGEDGRPDFEGLQSRWLLSKERDVQAAELRTPSAMYVFDIIHDQNFKLTQCRLSDRKDLLLERLIETENIKGVKGFDDGLALLEACRAQKLEGVVAKRNDSLYLEGARSKDWIKVKFTETDKFVVVGYRKEDGFLLKRTADDAASIVGAVQYGISDANYKKLVGSLKQASKKAKANNDALWFEPTVWIEVEFMQWTKAGKLRFPVFKKFIPL